MRLYDWVNNALTKIAAETTAENQAPVAEDPAQGQQINTAQSAQQGQVQGQQPMVDPNAMQAPQQPVNIIDAMAEVLGMMSQDMNQFIQLFQQFMMQQQAAQMPYQPQQSMQQPMQQQAPAVPAQQQGTAPLG